MSISQDFQTAIEHIEMLKSNFVRICDQYPNHLDPLNRYAKGHHTGYIAAMDAAIEMIRKTAEMQAKYGHVPAPSGNVIDLLEALRRTENPDYE